MRARSHALPFENEPGFLDADRETLVLTEAGRICLLHHLVLAADELAGVERLAEQSVRYALLAARLRDMASHPEWDVEPPSIAAGSAPSQSLVGLLAEAWSRRSGRFPGQGIEPELREAARELLHGLAWEVSAGRH